jgi:hypothetical protein
MSMPFSPSAEQNQAPILSVLAELFANRRCVLEIGSGTGQHAVYFGAHLPRLTWQPTDLAENLPGIESWRKLANLSNVLPPLALDVRTDPWPALIFDGAFSANTAHIMGWPAVEKMFAGLGRALSASATFALYGPFNQGGRFTSKSNQEFDRCLRLENADSGVRDFEALDALARKEGFRLLHDFELPVNNRILAWCRG